MTAPAAAAVLRQLRVEASIARMEGRKKAARELNGRAAEAYRLMLAASLRAEVSRLAAPIAMAGR